MHPVQISLPQGIYDKLYQTYDINCIMTKTKVRNFDFIK